MKPFKALLCLAAIMLPVVPSAGQTPVRLIDQPGFQFIERFDSIHTWEDGFTSGYGAAHWSPVGIQPSGTIPDGITTTVTTDSFAKKYLTPGIHKSPSTTPETYLEFLTSGTADYSSALAVDFWVDFAHLTPGILGFDALSIHNGTPGSDRHAMLQVYYSTDGQSFHVIPDLQFEAINYQDTMIHIEASLPDSLADHIVAFRLYSFNTSGGNRGARPRIGIDNLKIAAHEEDLPLRLISFSAEAQKGGVLLKWVTASEQHAAYFVVERSADGQYFQALTRVRAAGYSNLPLHYQYLDFLQEGMDRAFYRLKMVDMDERFRYSAVVMIRLSGIYLKRIYPNPASHQLTLQWNKPVTSPLLLRLIGADGKRWWEGEMHAGSSLIHIPLPHIPAGIYWIQVQEPYREPYAFPVVHLP
ncbi:MAG: T9SS type A sorting domain-containing protein [Thermoflavifilum sp.]|nr:T9SS type A sorting domain-containing protein [Thermoflavifilum sp.]